MEPPRNLITEALGHPLITSLILGAMSAYAGFLTGQTTMENKITDLTRRIGKVEAMQVVRSRDYSCAARYIDRLQDKTGIQPPCALGAE